MSTDGYDSPAGVDTPLDYISVENYQWPKPPSPKRSRLDEQERRRRHCECQKRFLARKRRDVAQLRVDVTMLELQLQLAEAIRETRDLQLEHSQLAMQNAGVDGVVPVPLEQHKAEGHGCESVDRVLDVDSILAELGLPW